MSMVRKIVSDVVSHKHKHFLTLGLFQLALFTWIPVLVSRSILST
jgi:hypothetical protein